MNDFDLIIVGAGPGGSNAAAVALDARLRVLQVDSARFPRVKPCAGGVTLNIVNRTFRIAAPRAMATAIEINIPRSGRERTAP